MMHVKIFGYIDDSLSAQNLTCPRGWSDHNVEYIVNDYSLSKKPYSYAALYRKQECRLADGAPDDARFAWPSDVLINEKDPSKLLVLDDGSHSIREVDIATGVRIAENAQSFTNLK